MLNVLILGGTTEASALAAGIAGDGRFCARLSLAGRTRAPAEAAVPMRVGGFGGVEGLADYLRANGVGALVDATHPFAALMSFNAAAAAARAGVPLLGLRRPAWDARAGDRWTMVRNMGEAAAALGLASRRVFLTVGQKELLPFRDRPQHHYLIRSVDPPPADVLPPRRRVISARGPFREADERALLEAHGIDVVVTKNSGGAATRPKLDAARALGLPVVMVERPVVPDVPAVATAQEALAWLGRVHGTATLRGV